VGISADSVIVTLETGQQVNIPIPPGFFETNTVTFAQVVSIFRAESAIFDLTDCPHTFRLQPQQQPQFLYL
jgi:hypothetical protein